MAIIGRRQLSLATRHTAHRQTYRSVRCRQFRRSRHSVASTRRRHTPSAVHPTGEWVSPSMVPKALRQTGAVIIVPSQMSLVSHLPSQFQRHRQFDDCQCLRSLPDTPAVHITHLCQVDRVAPRSCNLSISSARSSSSSRSSSRFGSSSAQIPPLPVTPRRHRPSPSLRTGRVLSVPSC